MTAGQARIASSPGLSQSDFSDIVADVQRQCSDGRFSGQVVVEQHGRDIVRTSCSAPGTPSLASNARFKLFSMSKMMTGIAIARLIELGRVSETASIRHYLPDAPRAWAVVTVRNLLQHTSGIPDLTNDLLEAFQTGAPTHRSAVRQVLGNAARAKTGLAFKPGTKWQYNNFGYELLAQIGATVEHRRFDEILTRMVLRPAGMRDAVVARPLFRGRKLAGSVPVPRLIPGFNGSPNALEPTESFSFVQLGAGAIVASASDLVAFDLALASGRLQHRSTEAHEAQTAYPAMENVRYGFGMMYRLSNGCAYLEHSGGTNGYVSDFARVPSQDSAVIILSNLGFGASSALRTSLVDRITSHGRCAA